MILTISILVVGGCGDKENSGVEVERNGEGGGVRKELPVVGIEEAEVPIGKVVDWDQEVDNPSSDGWQTEVRAATVKEQLKKIAGALRRDAPAKEVEEALADLVSDDYQGDRFGPFLEEVYKDEHHEVMRLDRSKAALRTGGREGLAHEGEFKAVDREVHFKVVAVTSEKGEFETEQIVSYLWNQGDGVVEVHARWKTRWEEGEEGRAPKLKDLRVTHFERARTTLEGGRLFVDCTESVLGENESYREQLLHGLNHWHERLPFRNSLNGLGTPGLALGDVNGDGLDDLYLCQHPGLPNRLYLQNADGTAREASREWGVDWIDDSRCALLVDLDNDGDRDLVVAVLGHVVVAINREQKRFEVAQIVPMMESTISLAAADYDRDGRVDIFVGGYAPDTTTADSAPTAVGFGSDQFVYHDANNSVGNVLLRNEAGADGAVKLTDVTTEAGLNVNNRRWTLAATWEDYDEDGDPDLYVANDFGRNNLYRNDGGTFVDVAALLGVEDSASGMSVSWGDYDRDGRLDLYVANMFSAAGNRIVGQSGFKRGITGDVRRRYLHFARGNTLLRNLEGGFADSSVEAGVTLGRWAWSSLFADLNNDGWEDLVVANGHITASGDSGDL